MGRKAVYTKQIEHLLSVGYEAKDIVKITNIPKGTIYRIVDQLREEAKINFDQLMTKDYLYKYQMNLENYSKTIVQCNIEIETVNKKYDELEKVVMESLEVCPVDKYIARSAYMTNLINIRNNRTIEIQKLIAQRDKSSEMKAKIFNSGPVVYRINQVVENKVLQPEMLSEQTMPEQTMPELVNNTTVEEKVENIEESDVISEEDLQVLKEMEEDV